MITKAQKKAVKQISFKGTKSQKFYEIPGRKSSLKNPLTTCFNASTLMITIEISVQIMIFSD